VLATEGRAFINRISAVRSIAINSGRQFSDLTLISQIGSTTNLFPGGGQPSFERRVTGERQSVADRVAE
jgi:hypothetical protein